MLLTISEAAKQLAVSTSTIDRLLANGELQRVKIGRAVRIDADDIRAFVRRNGGGNVQREPLSPKQLSAYHAKCHDIAKLSQREVRDVKASAMEHASGLFGRRITSSKQLTYVEMHDLLDWLEGRVELCRTDTSASGPAAALSS